MKMRGVPGAMWALFARSFRQNLTTVLGIDAPTAKAVTKAAKRKYREILADLPDGGRADRLLRARDDDPTNAAVLPSERQKQVYRIRH